MTVILNSGSSVTLTTGSETTLTQIGTPGRYQFIADLVNFAAGDVVEFRAKVMAAPAGTTRVLEYMQYQGLQPADDVIKMGSVIPNDQTDAQALVFTAKQIFGTGRSLIWKVLRVDAPDVTLAVQGGFVSVSGTVTVGVNNDKTGYFLGTPQIYDRIGNTTGNTQGNIVFVVTGTAAAFDPSTVWSFTGARALNGLQQWNLSGTITNVFNVINQVLASGVVNPVTAGNVVRANLIQIDGKGTSGTYANLNLNSLNILSSGVSAVKIANQTAHIPFYIQGSPAQGVNAVQIEGANSAVLLLGGQGGNGDGLTIESQGQGHGIDIIPFGTGDGIAIFPVPPSGAAIRFNPSDGMNLGLVGNIVGIISGSDHYGNWHGNLIGNVSGSVGQVQQVINVLNPVVADVRSLVGVSGTVVASAVQGGFVTVSGAVTLQPNQVVTASVVQGGFVTVSGAVNLVNNQVVNFSGTITNVVNVLNPVLASAVQGLVGVSGVVTVGVNQDKTGYSLSNPQNWNLIGNITGTIVGNISGTVGAVATVLDKVNYFLGTPQRYDRIGNTTGSTQGNITTVITGAAAAFDPSLVWSFTGARALNGLQQWNLIGNITGSVVGNITTVITGAAAAIDYSQVWAFTGSRSLNGLQSWNLIGNISGTVVNNLNLLQEVEDMLALLNGNERAIMGNIYYVDGMRGNDIGGDGTRLNPFKTITRALIPVVAHNHDGIFLLPVPTGTNTVTETGTVLITKDDVQILGPGYDVLVTNIPANNRDIFNIQAQGVGLHQFRMTTAGNSSNGVTFSNGASLGILSHVWIESVTQDGVFINVGNRNRILNSYIQTVGRDGIRISSGAGSGTYNHVEDNVIRSNGGHGVNLLGVDASNTIIRNNILRDNIGEGVSVGAGTLNTEITDNRIFNNTAGPILDLGTNTLQQWNFFNTDVVGIPLAVYNLVSGTPVNAQQIWQYTGSRTVNGVLGGFVIVSGTVVAASGTINTVYNLVSGAATPIDYSQVWSFTGSKIVDAVKGGYVTPSGTVVVSSGVVNTVYNVVSGTAANIDYSAIWNFTGSKIVDAVKGGYVNASGVQVTVTGVQVDPTSIWNFPTRTLTNQVFNAPPVAQGNNLNIIRGDTFVWAPTNLGSLVNVSKLYFTIKRIYADLDSESELQVEKSAGLVYINRAPALVPANGSIVINDVNLGNITITVQAVETAKLDLLMDVAYDVQFINTSGTVTTLVSGPVTIQGDATRSTGP